MGKLEEAIGKLRGNDAALTELNLHDEVECCKGGATANGGDKSITVYASCCGTIMYQLMRCLLTMPSLPILALLLVTALMHVNN